nr:PIN-like domain-containing protein [uncultured Devosia sp.]
MTAPKENKPALPVEAEEVSPDGSGPFKLEGIFEDATQIFKPNRVKEASSPDVIIALDTNVLLLPYTIRKDGLPKLQKFYQDLRAANRLYLPARVAREFIVHRDKKLAELLKMITDVRSKINIGETKLSPILEGVEGSEAMAVASKALAEAKSQYTKAISVVEEQVQSWSGDDPVTSVYDAVFDGENIISPTQTNDVLLAEWQVRLKERIPPGYKDGGKADTGIGDFLVWKALLALGAAQKKDLIFVTGEEKADWFVRVNGAGAYPRPELVAEYRKHSGGKGLRLVEFHDVLREMDVAQEVVIEVEKAETTANNFIRATALSEMFSLNTTASTSLNTSNAVTLRMHYGGEDITFKSDGVFFKFSVSEAGWDSMYVYPNSPDDLYPVPVGTIGETVQLEGLQFAGKAIKITKGQMACFRNAAGFTLILRLLSANLPEKNKPFEVSFAFAIFSPDCTVTVP